MTFCQILSPFCCFPCHCVGYAKEGKGSVLFTAQNVIVNAPMKYILAALSRLATLLPAALFFIQQARLTDEGPMGFSLLMTFMPSQVF